MFLAGNRSMNKHADALVRQSAMTGCLTRDWLCDEIRKRIADGANLTCHDSREAPRTRANIYMIMVPVDIPFESYDSELVIDIWVC